MVSPHVSSNTLMLFRLFAFCFNLAVFLLDFCLVDKHPETYLYYFTHLAWLGLIVYNGTCLLMYFALRNGVDLAKSHSVKSLHHFHFVIQICNHIFIPSIYWTVIYNEAKKYQDLTSPLPCFTNITKHAMTLVFMLIELSLCTMPIYLSHWWPPVLIAISYTCYENLIGATKGVFVYYFVDPNYPNYIAIQITVIFFTLPIFGIAFALTRFRDFVRKRMGIR